MTSAQRVLSALRRGVSRRALIWSAAALTLLALGWTLSIGWWLPRFLQPRIEASASKALGAPLKLDHLEISPWRLEARAHGLRLGPAEAPWLRVAELRADVSSESLWRFAPVLERLLVREPHIELERTAPGRFNITPMLEALGQRPPSPEGAEPERFALHNIRLEGGRIHFIDRVAQAEHRVEALQIGIPFLSNLPSKVTVDVEPLLDAQVDGSRLHVLGKTQPFSEGLHSTIAVDWQQIDVPHWIEAAAPLLPQALPFAVQRGRLDLALQIGFERRAAPAVASLHVGGSATLSQLQASMPAQGLQLAWERLALEGLDLRPLERYAAISAVKLQKPALDVDLPHLVAPPSPAPRRDKLMLDPVSAPASAATRAASAPAGAGGGAAGAWRWRVAKVELADGRALLREPAWPQGQVLMPIQAGIAGLDARADAPPATLALSLADARGAQVKLTGTLGVAARQAALKVEVTGLQAAPWSAPWQARLPVRMLGGSLAMQALAEVSATGWALHDGGLQLSDLQLQPAPPPSVPRGAPADRLSLPRLEASGVQLRADSGEALMAQVAALRLERLDLKASRGENGAMAWLSAPQPPRAGEDAQGARAGPTPLWQLGELRCSSCAVALADLSVKPAVAVAITRTDLTLRKLGSDLQQPIAFELSAAAGRGASVKARGDVRPQPLALHSRVELAALDLGMLQPYLEPHVNVTLAAAKVSAAGDLRIDGGVQQPVSSARWRGSVALNDLRALDKLNAAEFVRFKSLSLDGADLAWHPGAFEADLGTVALDDFYGRVIINADGRINLRDVVRHEGEDADRSLTTPSSPESAASAPVAASAPAAGASAAAPAQLRWRAIRLARGGVDFTDNFIRPNYSARLTDIAGDVSALAWNDPQPATVRVAGKVDGSAPLEIGGTVHPLGARLHTDITASARGIDITRLSAYAARYAGYGIEKGSLSVKVRYKIDNGKLEAENNLYLDQLTFGAKVDSPSALKLPVLLAVSLLKDRNGVIDVDLPVSGSLDDPQFSIGGIIVRVIVNLITKAVTAPFTLLAHAFGGGEQELGYVEFEPGSAELNEAGNKRLDALAKALNDRPALKLEATGRADPALDAAALRQAHVERLMRAAKAKTTGEAADDVRIEPAERTRWLEAAYRAADLKGKPRNLIGLQKSLPAADMEALLLQSAPAGAEQLKALADERGDRVKAYLATRVPPERVLLSASQLGSEGIDDKGRPARVSFALK